MAATGNTVTLQSNSYQGRYMKLTCTSTSNPSTNKTTISWKLESIGGSSSYYATICRVYIAGTEVYNIDKGYSYKQFPVAKGETTGSVTVEMDNSGNKLIYVDMDVAIYTSTTTRYSVDGGWQLPTVPRYPTISSFSVNKISGSSTSLSFVWAASAPGGNISKLEYSTDNGATFKTASSVTSPLTVGGLASAQGYNCKIRVTSSASGLTATTTTPYYQTTYQQPTANISTANISGYNGISQVKVSWSSNMTISTVKYSKDNGATWSVTQSPNATSGNYTFTGLTEGSTPNFKVQVTAATGSCVTTSGTSQKTLYTRVKGNLYVNGTKVATNNGQTGVALKNGDTLQIKDISNPGNLNYKLFFENPDNQHQYTSSATSGTNTLSMNADQIFSRLQYFPNDPSQGFNVGIVTLNDSSQHALYHEFFGTISAVNVNPTFDENRWTYQDINASTVALTGSNQILVNGFSKLRVSVNTAASGNGYATIKQYAVSGCTSGSSSTTGNIDCPNATNGGTIKVTAKDSRNNVTETTKTATFKDYFVPTLTSISATRNNGGVGTQTSMTFNGTWWNANFGASANTLTAVYRYKSGSSWSDPRAITLTTSGNTYSFNTSQLYGDLNADGFTLGTTFTIEVIITDALNGGKSWTTVLNSGTPAIAISGNNIAVGSQYDTNKGGKIQINNGELGAINVTSNDLAFKQTSTQTGKAIGFGVGGGGTNRGCWDFVKSQWLWYDNDSNLYLNKPTRIPGAAADQPLRVRGIVGCDSTAATAGELHLNYGVDAPVKFGKDATTYVQASGMIRGVQAGSWVKDRDNSLVRNAYNGNGAYAPVICQGTKTGTWTVGCLSGEDKLTFNYETDTKYNNNTNTEQRVTIDTNGNYSGKALNVTQVKTLSSKSHSNYGTNNGYLPDMSFIAYWNGAYSSSTASNLTYAHQGEIQCKPISLYDNATGSAGTITLSQTAANFTYLEIFYKDQKGSGERNSVRVYSPNQKYFSLQILIKSGSNDMRLSASRGYINGTSITRGNGAEFYLNGGRWEVEEVNIIKVVGWK